jgi:hypothetical protein
MKTCVTWLLLACTAVAGWSETPARANGSRHVVNVSNSAARPRNIKRECEYNPEPIIYWDLAGSPGETESCYSGGPQLVGYVGPMALDAAKSLYLLQDKTVYVFPFGQASPSASIPLARARSASAFARTDAGDFWAADGDTLIEFDGNGNQLTVTHCVKGARWDQMAVDHHGDLFVSGSNVVAELRPGAKSCRRLTAVAYGGSSIAVTRNGDLVVGTPQYPNGGTLTTYGHPHFDTVVATTPISIPEGQFTVFALSGNDKDVYAVVYTTADPNAVIVRYLYPSGEGKYWFVHGEFTDFLIAP